MVFIFSPKLEAEGVQIYRELAPLQVFSKVFAQIFSYM